MHCACSWHKFIFTHNLTPHPSFHGTPVGFIGIRDEIPLHLVEIILFFFNPLSWCFFITFCCLLLLVAVVVMWTPGAKNWVLHSLYLGGTWSSEHDSPYSCFTILKFFPFTSDLHFCFPLSIYPHCNMLDVHLSLVEMPFCLCLFHSILSYIHLVQSFQQLCRTPDLLLPPLTCSYPSL